MTTPLGMAIESADAGEVLRLLTKGFDLARYYKLSGNELTPQDLRLPIASLFRGLAAKTMLLGIRLDILYILYKYSLDQEKILKAIDNKSEKYKITEYVKRDALALLSFYLDLQTVNEIESAMRIRHRTRVHNIEHIPGQQIVYNTTPAESAVTRFDYRWLKIADYLKAGKEQKQLRMITAVRELDAASGARYLTNVERDYHRVYLYQGLLHKKPGILFSTIGMTSHLHDNFAAFVINVNGEISVFNHYHNKSHEGYYVHSSMNALNPVFSAGEMVVQGGKLQVLTGYSGHYVPDQDNTFELLQYFISRGVDLSETKVCLSEPLTYFLNIPDYNDNIHSPFIYKAMDIYENVSVLKKLIKSKTAIQLAIALEKIPLEKRLLFFQKLPLSFVEKLIHFPEELNLLQDKLNRQLTRLNFIDRSIEKLLPSMSSDNDLDKAMIVDYVLYILTKNDIEALVACLKIILDDKMNIFQLCVTLVNKERLLDLIRLLDTSQLGSLVNIDNVFDVVRDMLMYGSDEVLDITLQKLSLDLKDFLYDNPLLFASSEHSVSPTQWLILLDNNLPKMRSYILGKSGKGTFGFIDAANRLVDERRWGDILEGASISDFKHLFSDSSVLEHALKTIKNQNIWALLIDVMTPQFLGLQLERISFANIKSHIMANPAAVIIYTFNPWVIDLRELSHQGQLYGEMLFLQHVARAPERLNLESKDVYQKIYDILASYKFIPAFPEEWLVSLNKIQRLVKNTEEDELHFDLLQIMIVKIMMSGIGSFAQVFAKIRQIHDFEHLSPEDNFLLGMFVKMLMDRSEDRESDILYKIYFFKLMQEAVDRLHEGATVVLMSELKAYVFSDDVDRWDLDDKLKVIFFDLLWDSLISKVDAHLKGKSSFFPSQFISDVMKLRAACMKVKDASLGDKCQFILSIDVDKHGLFDHNISLKIKELQVVGHELMQCLSIAQSSFANSKLKPNL